MDLDIKIESILFFKGEPVAIKKLAQILNVSEPEISDALKVLEEKLQDRGVCLMQKDDSVMLGTTPSSSELIESIIKEDLNKDLGKAGLETLSIILYRGPIRRSEIDYIRGVNSQFVLRHLLIRGLIEKEIDAKDQRVILYKPTFELMSYLGIKKLEELPEFSEVRKEIENFNAINKEDDETQENKSEQTLSEN
ncbi:MAG: SMC-Scp complex subunit ScpB [Candidatus Paceibacterota bacterium]